MCARRQSRGFTLIELIMVMLIVTIIVAVIAPGLGNFIQGRKAHNATFSILALANYARMQSANEGYLYRLNIDPKAGTVWLTSDQGGGFTMLTGGSDFTRQLQMPDGVKVDFLNIASRAISQIVQPDLLVTQPIPQPPPIGTGQQQMNVQGALTVPQERDPGEYIEFDPMGRSDTGEIVVTDQFGSKYVLSIDTPSEPMRILTDQEANGR